MTKKRLFPLLLLALPFSGEAQDGLPMRAAEGVVVYNESLRLNVCFLFGEDGEGNPTAVLDLPDMFAYDMPTETARVGDSLFIRGGRQTPVRFEGRIYPDSLVGRWFPDQMPPLALTLYKSDKQRRRPQQPEPPYPYRAEEVAYANADSTVRFGATLTLPDGDGPFPAAILLTGSGQQDRDESLCGHKPFRLIADYLTRRGIAVLRADDRGIGATTGPVGTATTEDFSRDALAGVTYLKSRSEIDPRRIGLIGHSEGAMIAMLVARGNPDIAYAVSLAGPAVTGVELGLTQARENLKDSIADGRVMDSVISLLSALYGDMARFPEKPAAQIVAEITARWMPAQDSATRAAAGMVCSDGEWIWPPEAIKGMTRTLDRPWQRYMVAFDPAPVLEEVRCPMLFLNGGKDRQVDCGRNLQRFREIARKQDRTNREFEPFADLNHLFQHCETGKMDEYVRIEETFAPEALERIFRWTDSTVRAKP